MSNYKTYNTKLIICFLFLLIKGSVVISQKVGIGTTIPDANAILDIKSTTKGIYAPRLNAAQQTTLASQLSTTQKGMLITDSATGSLRYWTGTAWLPPSANAALSAKSPLGFVSNNLKINAGTSAGDLITWDGNNWINTQPAVQHFNYVLNNMQPYTGINYCISLFGVFPQQSDAINPYVGEILLLGCNFAPVGYAFCDGQLLSIAENEVLFNLIGTTYGGDGQNTFGVPDLRGRLPIHQGQGIGLSNNYFIGQIGGSETKIFSR